MAMPRKPRGNCKNCEAVLNRPEKVFCNVSCQKQYEYTEYIRLWKRGLVSGSNGGAGVSAYIRRYLREKFEDSCGYCKWNRKHPATGEVPIEVHHKNGDGSDHREENLIMLCPNCHSLTPSYRGRNRGNGRKNR